MKITKILRFKDNMSDQELADYCVRHMTWLLDRREVNGNDREVFKALQEGIQACLVDKLEGSEAKLVKTVMKLVDHLQEASRRDMRLTAVFVEALQSLAESKGLDVVIGIWDGEAPYFTAMSKEIGELHLASLSNHPRFQEEFPFPTAPEPMGDD